MGKGRAPRCQCKSPRVAEPNPRETGRVSAGSHKRGSRGCACNHVCPQASAFVGSLDNGYSLPAGARTLAPTGHPSIRTPGISVPFSLPSGVLLTLQIQLLRSIIPWFPWGV